MKAQTRNIVSNIPDNCEDQMKPHWYTLNAMFDNRIGKKKKKEKNKVGVILIP